MNTVFCRIRWQRENGLMDKQKRRWFPKKPICEGSRGFTTVGLQEVKPALFIWFVGVTLSIVLVFAEIAVYKTIIYHNKMK